MRSIDCPLTDIGFAHFIFGCVALVARRASPEGVSLTVSDITNEPTGEALTLKSDGEIMEILAAYDLTGSFRAAGELAECSHHTVAAHLRARDSGLPVPVPVRRPRATDEFLPKIEEWVEQSKGKIRGDKAHKRLRALGFTCTVRSTRRALAPVKKAYLLGHTRVHRPWITEPGLWLQYDFGEGPLIEGNRTTLFVA